MAVSPWDGDVFVGIRVVESATKGLVTACQSMEITAEIISKHYAEVGAKYLSILHVCYLPLKLKQCNNFSFLCNRFKKYPFSAN